MAKGITTCLVSYNFMDETGKTGFGDTTIKFDKRLLLTPELIERIRKQIKEEYNLKKVIILNVLTFII